MSFLKFFEPRSGFSMTRLCAFLLVLAVSFAIIYLAVVKGAFSTPEAVAVGSITTMLAAVWWKKSGPDQGAAQ